MTRSPADAIAWAREHRSWEPGYCLQYVRTAYGVDPFYASASDAWRGAEHKHRISSGAQVPRGVPVYWTGGSHGYGHITIATGNGNCWSTDAAGAGSVAKVNIDELTARWGLYLQGWAADVNGVRVWSPPTPAGPAHGELHVVLALLRPQQRNKDILDLERALHEQMPHYKYVRQMKVDGYFGGNVRKAYAEWQRRCGFTGKAANGIPGRTSLERLGFTVH